MKYQASQKILVVSFNSQNLMTIHYVNSYDTIHWYIMFKLIEMRLDPLKVLGVCELDGLIKVGPYESPKKELL